jgi:hypothetical protein
MVDNTAGIHIGQGLTGQATTLLFLIQPRRKCLLDDPVSRTIQTLCELINPFGQVYWDVCRH